MVLIGITAAVFCIGKRIGIGAGSFAVCTAKSKLGGASRAFCLSVACMSGSLVRLDVCLRWSVESVSFSIPFSCVPVACEKTDTPLGFVLSRVFPRRYSMERLNSTNLL